MVKLFVMKNKIVFDVCKAHSNMQDKSVNDGSKKQVISFLRKQKTPFDFDVRSCYWDGVNLELSCTITGDEFLEDPDQLDYIAAIQKATE